MKILTENDFNLAFTNKWLNYAKRLIYLIPEESLKSFITDEMFRLTIKYEDFELMRLLFTKSSTDVQQTSIEDYLNYFVIKDKYNSFMTLLETKIIKPKIFLNGETLFTNLLKDKNVKYCHEIIRNSENKQYLNLVNASNQSPLQISINNDLHDFICPLVFECENLNNEDIKGRTPLIELFEKLTMSTDVFIDYFSLFNILRSDQYRFKTDDCYQGDYFYGRKYIREYIKRGTKCRFLQKKTFTN